MPQYDIAVPGKGTFRVNSPTPLTDEQAWQAVQNQMSAPEPKAAGFSLKDLALSFGQGVGGGAQALTDVAGAGNVVSKGLTGLQQAAGEAMTPERQAEILRRQEIKKKAEGNTLEEIKAVLGGFAEAPLQTLAQGAGSIVPMVLGTALMPAAAVPAAAARLASLGVSASTAAKVASSLPAATVGAMMGVGGQKGQDYETVKRELLEKKIPEEEAERLAQKAAEYSLQNVPRQLASGAAGALAGGLGVESLVGRIGKKLPEVKGPSLKLPEPTVAQAIGKSTAAEALPEALQSAVSTVGTNVALNQAGVERDLTQGVLANAINDALVGGILGAGASPLKLKEMRQQYVEDEFKGQQEYQKQQQEEIAANQKKIKDELDMTQNPLGMLTIDDLGADLFKVVQQNRADTGKPALTSFSLDDVVDALPGKDKAAETASLNAIIAAKTGYTNEVYTPAQVIEAAQAKNVETGTQGFSDFLSRTTGLSNPAQMSQPQLHAAITSLAKLPGFTSTQSLPEGLNATNYTPEQFTKAIDGLNAKMDELGKDDLSFKEVTKAIETATGLKGSAVNALLNDANRSGDIITDNKKVSVPSRTTPTGYGISEEVGAEQEQATSYEVRRGDEILDEHTTKESADQQVEGLNKLTAEEIKNIDESLKTEEAKINKAEKEVQRLILAGNRNTPEFKAAQDAYQQVTDESFPRIAELKARKESYQTPLTVAPIGVKKVKPKSYVVRKGQGIQTVKQTREEAEQAIFEDLLDTELQELAKKRSPALQKRVNAEIQRRAALPAKPAPAAEATATTPEQQAKLDQLKQDLPAMLKKFGLGDVGLKIVNAIEGGADGSYEAKLIQIALGAEKPIETMRHEAIHALKELGFFTPQQWAALERQAKKEWVKKYLEDVPFETTDGKTISRYEAYKTPGIASKEGLNEEQIIEEAIADAFGDWDSSKAPGGMLTALLNKMRNFFSALRSYLNGEGFQTYKDVFGKIEKGELKATAPAKEGEAKKSLIRPAVEGETEISTQNPQGVKRKYDPITDMLSIDEAAVREAMEMNPDIYQRTVNAIKGYGFVPTGTANKDVISTFKRNIINNLLFLHDQVPEDIRVRSKLWYDGANRIAVDMAKNYKVSKEQVSAIMAAMSPQKDWFQNVSMAERALDVMTEQGNKAWDENMLKYAKSYVDEAASRKEREKREIAFKQIQKVARAGTTLNDMDLNDAAAFIRAYDEAYHSREYRIVTPEGGFGDLVRKNDGNPATMMWSTYDPIKKSVSIYRNGNRKNISEQLGEEHKIRSFYNNIAAPNSDIGHVTIDTHAVAAGLFEALAGTDVEVAQNFGGTGGSDIVGVGGTYGIIADAYREAAAQRGVRAREMQSITWEAVRGLFGEDIKSTIKPKIRAEWAKYKNGDQTFNATREKVMEIAGGIDDPDWVGSGSGDFVSDGATSYDKTFTPEGGVRLREAKDIREKLTFNLSAVTNSIPGLRELYQRAMGRDKEAYTVLQKVAESSLKFLLSGTGAKVSVDYAKGVYLSDREPSISVGVSFSEREMNDVMAGLAKFAESYNQQQIHVRQETAQKFGHDFGDGSYATAVYEIGLKKALNNEAISRVIDDSGLQGFTITDNKLTAYFVRTEGDEKANFKSFGERIKRVNELVGDGVSRPKQTTERLYVYGEGYGARIPYSEVAYSPSDIRTKQASDTVTPKLIAEYLTKAPVVTFKQKPLSAKQVKEQERLSKAFDAMPINDLKNPLVKRAYTALANSLKEQYQVMPIKVELMDTIDEPYANSDAVRRDVSVNNRFKVYATSPETFGPPGSDFKNHPLLKDSGLKDVNGRPMLYNDLLRAVHDYFAHNLTETQFGPNGEAAAWRNHMSITPDPFARWALTAETRAQNAWQNFRPEAKGLSLIERGFADQKASLPPLEFVMTGDAKIDQPVTELKEVLTPEQQRGSVPTGIKYSLRKAPDTPAFKQFFGNSVVVNADGTPKVMYHGTARDIKAFKPRQAGAIFLTENPEFAGEYADVSAENKALERDLSDYSAQELEKAKTQAIKDVRASYGNNKESANLIREIRSDSQQGEALDFLKLAADNLFPEAGQNIMPVYVRSERPFDYENPDHIAALGLNNVDKEDLANNVARLESDRVQNAIRAAGFDGFYIKQGNQKNLAVYDPVQIKSATGNIGTFDRADPDIRYSLRKAPDTPEFKQWFGKSKAVDADGKPMVMYHGTDEDITEFRPYIFATPNPKVASQYPGGGEPAGQNIMPVYVRAENPFDYENPSHINKLRSIIKDREQLEYIEEGLWSAIESPDVLEAIQKLGFDSFYSWDLEKNIAVFNPEQIKSAIGNRGTYDINNLDIRYSLSKVKNEVDSLPNGAAINASINRLAPGREQKGYIERILDAFKPQSVDALRQQFLNRYNQLGVYDKEVAKQMGGAALLADSSAESAALMSDNAAAIASMACGIEGKGGIPVFDKGYTTISNANGEKGVLEILMPLAKIGDPRIYQTYQFWAGSLRGSRLLANGTDHTYTKAEIDYAKELLIKYPEFKQVQEDWIKYNNGLMKYAVETGVLSPEKAAEFMKYSDYIPFYRQIDGEKTVGPRLFQNISGVTPPKKLKGLKEGQDIPFADFLETIVRNTQSIIQSGMKNTAAQRAIGQAVFLKMADKRQDVSYAPGVVTVLENGKPVSYDVADQLFIDAVKSLNMPELPFLSFFAAPANLLRNLVTKDPGFMMANLMRDSLSAWVTSGAKMTPIASTISNFGKAIGGKDPAYIALRNAGVIGGYEFAAGVENSGIILGESLRRATGTQTGTEKALKPFTSLWRGLEKGTEASDAATRMAVYKATLEKTGNEAEAIYRAMEVMNFNRKGNLAIVRILTAAVPFLNARMQGLDVFYRAAFGKMATEDAAAIQKSFFIRGATLMALTSMYWFLTHEDEEYLAQEQETRDNNWLFPSAGIRIPIPFEVGVLFKVVPERILEYSFGSDTGKDMADSFKRNLISTFAFNPIPQTVLPLVEARTNYSFFTMRPIVGQGMENVAKEYQMAPNTSEAAKKLGQALGESPIIVDHIMKGYTGSLGMYAIDLIDAVLLSNDASPKPAKRFEQMPVIKRFIVDKEAKGTVTAYYELKNSVDEVVRTINLMERTSNVEDMGDYIEKNANLLGMKGYISSVEKQMKVLREAAIQIRSSDMSPEEKRESLSAITQAQNAMTANIREIKKSIQP